MCNPLIAATTPPPIMEAQRLLTETKRNPGFELLNLTQAAPMLPPPKSLRMVMAQAVLNETASHLYGPVLGNSELREEIANCWSKSYGASIDPGQVAVTSGCNQAFTAAVSALAKTGDAVMIVSPWYFNHKMWLDMMGIEARILNCDSQLIPDIESAKRLLDHRVKAITLITPNNPTGAEYPNDVLLAFYHLAREHGIHLILDETYRDFCTVDGKPHTLFQRSSWDRTLIQLYSFSKAYRLTGHRIGSIITSTELLREVEKFLDTVTICASQIGQLAALAGIRSLSGWVEQQRQTILDRRLKMINGFRAADGWKLLGCGGFFAYVEHPFDMPSREVVKRMLTEIGILALPGELFAPAGAINAAGRADRQLRLAFANISGKEIREFFTRLAQFDG